MGACKNHIRVEHQTEVHIKGLPPITRLNGFFHCPKCSYKSHNAQNFHRHTHIQQMREISDVPTGPQPQAPTRHSTLAPRSSSSPPLAPIEIEEGLDDDPMDEDYEPMDIEGSQPLYVSTAQGLIYPPALQSLQLGIDQEHHCIVCEGCQCAVQRQALYNHVLCSHGHVSRLPPNIHTILDEHQVPHHIHSPKSKVIPVASIPIIPGFMCTVPGCWAAGQFYPSFSHNHSRLSHPGIPAKDCITPCLIQIVFPAKNDYQVWVVDHDYATLPPSIDYVSALDKIKQHDACGWDDGTVQIPGDPCHINGFLKEYRWLRITEGKNYEELCGMVESPCAQKPALLPLKDKLEGYFDRIKPIMKEMAPLVLRWVNTAEG